jgi:flagellar basal-body rod protein FlgB
VFIGDIVNSGSIPSLELTLRFAGQRQRLLAHNIANWNTPNFRPMDVSPAAFQKALSSAIDDRRANPDAENAPLTLPSSREIQQTPAGDLTLIPRTPGPGILAQDRNNTDLERLMQDHAENAEVYRIASELLHSRLSQLKDAMAERV